jgi:SecD/SecF fusion protein
LLPAIVVVFAALMALFGGTSYEFYTYAGTMKGWFALCGLIAVFFLAIRSLRNFFGKFSAKINFALMLIAVLGSFFVYLFHENKYPMGIDLAGGTELIYRLDYTRTDENIAVAQQAAQSAKQKDPDGQEYKQLNAQVQNLEQSKKTAPDKAAEVVRRRIDPTGTKGIPVTTLGNARDRLRIQLPKATKEEVDRIKEAIQTRGRLAFHIEADETKDRDIVMKTMQSPNGIYVTPEGVQYEKKDIKRNEAISGKVNKRDIVINRIPEMDGSHVALANARPSSEGGWEIALNFDSTGGVQFGQLTGKHVGDKMAIVLDGRAYSDPVIKTQIFSDCVISGSFTEKEASELATVLTAGSLPADVKPESSLEVGPSLGREQVNSGMTAMVIGTAVVILFMLIYYRFSGLVASFCMLLNLPMLLGAMGFFKATLTLPGIAGIVLTLGMAVDANVLIIERLREELARGRSIRLAVSHGFDRAFLTIIDCHSTTLISSIVLYYMGTGPVRGFAVSLSVGILTTLFCNLWLNWLIMDWLVSRDALPGLNMMQFFKHSNIDFMGWRRLWMTLTGALAAISIVLFAVDQKDLYDVDFTGGTRIQFNFQESKPQDPEAVRKKVDTIVTQGIEKRIAALGQPVTKVELSVQPVDRPENGKYRKFSVTMRETKPEIIEELSKEILADFKGDLEPDAITVADNSVLVRCNPEQDVTPKTIEDGIKDGLLKEQKDEMYRDPDKADMLKALTALKVESVTKGDDGYWLAKIGPLPSDPAVLQKTPTIKDDVVKVIGALKIPGRADGAISRKDAFGSQVAANMWWQALFALVIANLAVFIYIWFRFEFSGAWGFGAIVALIHDTIIATGGVVVAHMLGFPIRIDLNIVAALLTITGFSVNDTIVVFDRIREVKAAHPTRTYEEIVNEACNATLSRTVLTSLTVLLADASLLIFGGPTIRGMAYTLLVGFTVGTYSSIFIAAPLMIWWYRTFGTGRAPIPASTTSRPQTGETEKARV